MVKKLKKIFNQPNKSARNNKITTFMTKFCSQLFNRSGENTYKSNCIQSRTPPADRINNRVYESRFKETIKYLFNNEKRVTNNQKILRRDPWNNIDTEYFYKALQILKPPRKGRHNTETFEQYRATRNNLSNTLTQLLQWAYENNSEDYIFNKLSEKVSEYQGEILKELNKAGPLQGGYYGFNY